MCEEREGERERERERAVDREINAKFKRVQESRVGIEKRERESDSVWLGLKVGG